MSVVVTDTDLIMYDDVRGEGRVQSERKKGRQQSCTCTMLPDFLTGVSAIVGRTLSSACSKMASRFAHEQEWTYISSARSRTWVDGHWVDGSAWRLLIHKYVRMGIEVCKLTYIEKTLGSLSILASSGRNADEERTW